MRDSVRYQLAGWQHKYVNDSELHSFFEARY